MIVGVILAAGKGTRMKSKDKNKVTIPFFNKPLIVYSVELMKKVADKTVVVVGAYHQSVKEVLKNQPVIYAFQKQQLGTADATKVAVEKIIKLGWRPDLVLVGYGDHTMFYPSSAIKKLITLHQKEKAAMSIITVFYDNTNLHWGFIIRDKNNQIVDSIEFKDATAKQKKIKELNAGFYCFDFNFLKENIDKVPQSKVSGEYYLNSLIKIAASLEKKVSALTLPFSQVGIGINRWSELEESQRLYLRLKYPSPKTFILIPAYNEGKVIARVISSIKKEGFKNIIVVDDGSTDDTYFKAKKAGAVVLRHILNRGKGATVKTGIEFVKFKKASVVVTIDGDGQHNPKEIKKLVEKINRGYDVVLGSRFLNKKNKIPLFNRIANFFANILVFLVYGVCVNDSQSGFRAYGKRALKFINTSSDRYEFDSEVIREIFFHKLKYYEVPIDVFYTSYSLSKRHKQNWYNGLKTLMKLIFNS